MPVVRYRDKIFDITEKQSVLYCLTRNGVPIPYSCGNGVCQTCLMRAVEGEPPQDAQKGLKDSLVMQSYFLACACYPKNDLEVALPGEISNRTMATVETLKRLNQEIMLVGLKCDEPVEYKPGQFITLFQHQGLGRCYSIASVPTEDDQIFLHVRRLPQGQMSGWIHEHLEIGQRVKFRGPTGNCFYVPGNPERGMMLIGTGSGLAPLYGILRDALRQGHYGPIKLFHGSRDQCGLYLTKELHDMAKRHDNFEYMPCLSGSEPPEGFVAGRTHEVALGKVPNLQNWRVYLCGHPEMVKAAKKKAFLAGASMQDIYADAFHLSIST